jgi:hypothetical protein
MPDAATPAPGAVDGFFARCIVPGCMACHAPQAEVPPLVANRTP